MIDIKSTIISSDNGDEDKEIIDNLKNIFTTPQGTVPFDREFGIDMSIVDDPVNIAKDEIIVEFIRKAQIYEPRAEIKEVTFLNNGDDLIPKVRVT